MKYFAGLLFFQLLTAVSIGQSATFLVTGKVVDAVTKAPLQAASVFAQSTTIGTATNEAGMFSIRLYNGGYDLVITYTGYETITRRVTTADEINTQLVIELKQKEKALEEVSIVSSNEVKDGLEKYGDFFIENFMGKTPNSQQCVIQNKSALKFYFSKKRNRLKVMADTPLLIENPALGYTIRYTLDSFWYDYNAQTSLYVGYPLFKEMVPANEAQAAQWQQRRNIAYQGSVLHFMRALYNRQLKEQGFEVQFLVKQGEADMAIHLKDLYGALNYEKDDSTQVAAITPNQSEMAVIYKKEMPDEAYLLLNADAVKTYQVSIAALPAAASVEIERNGYYYDQTEFTVSGYWAWEKTGDMLPYDFVPSPNQQEVKNPAK